MFLGWTTLIIALLAAIQFAVGIEDAVRNAGFITINTTQGIGCGFLPVVPAAILRTLSVLARRYVPHAEPAAERDGGRPADAP